MKKSNANSRFLIGFLFLMTLLRLRVAGQFDLGVDEAHYMLYGKNLAWSYFDHPPLVGWIQFLFQQLPVNELYQARLAPILISILTSLILFRFLKSKFEHESHAVWGIIALNLTPLFNTLSIAMLPDTLLMPLTPLILIQTEALLKNLNLKNWSFLGLLLGLAALSKYTAILYVFALIFVFIYYRKWSELLRPHLWMGVVIAAVCTLPILYWNMQHQFASFTYQTKHVFSFNLSMLNSLATSMGIQIFSWGVGPFFTSVYFLVFALLNLKNFAKYRITLIYCSVFFAFFMYVALSEVLLPHWMLMFFVLALPVAAAFLLKANFIKVFWGSTGLSALISFCILIETGFHVFPIQWTAGLYEGVKGWQDVMIKANEKLATLKTEHKAIGVMNWTLGSRALYYNRNQSEVQVIDSRQDQFDIWNSNTPKLGYDFIIVIEAAKKEENVASLKCQSLTQLDESKTFVKNVPVNHFLYYHCSNFSGLN